MFLEKIFRTKKSKKINTSIEWAREKQSTDETCKQTKRENRVLFRDASYIFRASGKLVYKEPGNPYETCEIYLEMEPEGIVIKSYISERGPDGGQSWRGVFIDEKNLQNLKSIVGDDIEVFLRTYFQEHSSQGLSGLSKFLDVHEIKYESKYAL